MPLTPMPHLGKGGTGFHGTGPGTAEYLLRSLVAQGQFVVTGGAAEAVLVATGLKTTSVVTSAIKFDAGVPSVITGDVMDIPAANQIQFSSNTTGTVVLVTWVDPPQ
jgi:hypothetical protein